MDVKKTVLYHHRTQGRGVEAVHIFGVCTGLKELGYEVEIVGPPGVNTDPNVVVSAETGKTGTVWGKIARSVPQFVFELMEVGYNVAAVPRLLKRCRQLRPDFIYERYALYNASGVIVSRLTKTPLILEVNDTVSVDRTRQGKSLRMKWLARRFERYIFRGARGHVAVSGFLRDQIVETGVSPERVTVTPNAVETDVFNLGAANPERIRSKYALQGATVVGFAGSFAKWHRVDMLVEACASLAKDYPDMRLLLVGDGAKREETENQAKELGIDRSVIFTGKVPHAEMPNYMAAMDIGVMPESNVFGSPMKIVEYMAMGCPPVAPDYGPCEEVIDHGVNGLIFTRQDVASLAQRLRQLLQDPAYRKQIGEAAHEAVMSRHRWVHNAQAAVDLVGPRAGSPSPPPVAALR